MEDLAVRLSVVRDIFNGCCLQCKHKVVEKFLFARAQQANGQEIRGPLHNLLDSIAKEHGISTDDMRSRSNMRHIVQARREFAKIARTELHCSLPRIGQFLGKHHTTILHLINT